VSGIRECRKCKETKALQHFYKDVKGADGHRTICKPCSVAADKLYVQGNKDWYNAYKATLSCPCGENEGCCLEFHHRNPATKIKAVADMVADGYSRASIEREWNKCDVLCANCHRKKHHRLRLTV